MGCQGKASNDSFKLLSGLPASSDMLVRIFLFLAPERWNSDIRNASELASLLAASDPEGVTNLRPIQARHSKIGTEPFGSIFFDL